MLPFRRCSSDGSERFVGFRTITDVVDGDRCALEGKTFCNGPADPSGTAGDESEASGEARLERHSNLRL
jgi:hypothetical protein